MRLCIFLVLLFVTWVRGQQPPDYGSNVTMLSKENSGVRTKRTVTSPTAHPSPERVVVLRKQTEVVSYAIRKLLSWEVQWFYVMARKSTAEVVVYLVVGVAVTFIIILIPLVLLVKILVPPLPIFAGKEITDGDKPDFSLPYWMDQTESSAYELEEKHKCCFNKNGREKRSVRCFPVTDKYPWDDPCAEDYGDHGYKLH